MDSHEIHSAGRLVKVLLPPNLVEAMDDLIAASGAYRDRSQFIADAIDGHLSELRAQEFGRLAPELNTKTASSRKDRRVPGVASEAPWPRHDTIGPVVEGIPTLDPVPALQTDPTWGMHNRDFPTLWALSRLADATLDAGKPVAFRDWLRGVVAAAWEMARRLPNERFDTSGFPTNPSKREASEGRFLKFFVGEEPGAGPLFDLGLAGADAEGGVAPTPAGLTLLQALEGFGCEREREVLGTWTAAYLRHLAQHAPADFKFMSEIVRHIQNGQDGRTALLKMVTEAYPRWSRSVVDTNVAGFVARAREWGLLLPRQRKGKYVLGDQAIAALESAER
jgi:Arc/MetJ-type ribon-helix-helix transcriptional regulator